LNDPTTSGGRSVRCDSFTGGTVSYTILSKINSILNKQLSLAQGITLGYNSQGIVKQVGTQTPSCGIDYLS